MARNDRKIRGIRTPIKTSTFIGRISPGEGDAEMVPFSEVLTALGLTDEDIQDLVGAMLLDSTTIDFTYDDAGATITGIVIDGSITLAKMANLANQRLIGRNTAGVGVPEAITVSQVLDWVGNTRGAILYRGASSWAILAPGTSGQVLTTNGSGADPSWATLVDTNTQVMPLVNGDTPGPGTMTSPDGQMIGVEI